MTLDVRIGSPVTCDGGATNSGMHAYLPDSRTVSRAQAAGLWAHKLPSGAAQNSSSVLPVSPPNIRVRAKYFVRSMRPLSVTSAGYSGDRCELAVGATARKVYLGCKRLRSGTYTNNNLSCLRIVFRKTMCNLFLTERTHFIGSSTIKLGTLYCMTRGAKFAFCKLF